VISLASIAISLTVDLIILFGGAYGLEDNNDAEKDTFDLEMLK